MIDPLVSRGAFTRLALVFAIGLVVVVAALTLGAAPALARTQHWRFAHAPAQVDHGHKTAAPAPIVVEQVRFAGRVRVMAIVEVAPSFERGAAGVVWRGGARAAVLSWRSGSALVDEAARYVGSGKFTRLPGAWCADAVNVWLRAVGKPALRGRMAGDALVYGPRVANPEPGDLVVMRTRRGPAGHVGIVSGVLADGEIEIISGNWSHRVARAVISRRSVTAFVGT